MPRESGSRARSQQVTQLLSGSPCAPDRSPKPRGDPGPEVGWRGRDGEGRADTERRGRRSPGAARGVRGGLPAGHRGESGRPPAVPAPVLLHGAAQPALQRELESRSAPRSASHSAAHASAARRRPAGAGHAAVPAGSARPDTAARHGRRAESAGRAPRRCEKGGGEVAGRERSGPRGAGEGGKEGTCGTGREGRGR